MRLDEIQLRAVDSDSDKILVMAGAGAGKTAVMIQRIFRLTNQGVDPASILVLTFTNNAAFEMKQRYMNLVNPESIGFKSMKDFTCPEFRTFHSFCYSLIVKDEVIRQKLNYDQIPSVADEFTVKKIAKQAKMQTKFNVSEKKLQNLDKLTSREKQAYEIYCKALNRLLHQNNLITFDVLCYEVCKLFTNNDACVQKYKDQYKYIFVDEFQDTDPKQINFLNSFKNVNFYMTGDALQNIYQFRNCNNDALKLLSKDPTWEHIKLKNNYRSTNQICQYANNHSKYADKSYRIEMQGNRNGMDVEIIRGSEVNRFEFVDEHHLEQIKDIIANSNDDIAILCRTNKEVKYVKDYIKCDNFSQTDCSKCVHILNSVVSNDYMLNWLSSLLVSEQYEDYIRQASNTSNPDIKWFSGLYGQLPAIQQIGQSIVKIRKVLQCTESNTSKLFQILTLLNLDTDVLDIPEIPDDMDAVKFVQYIIEFIQNISIPNVYVGTIHSVKGLEFNHVIIVGVKDKYFRLDSEENKNIYYVAVTRAKNKLTVFCK